MNLKKLLDSGKSFIYIKNSSGPKMEPCGTPVTICNVLGVSFRLDPQLMRLAPLVAPLQVLAACQMYVIYAVVKVGQYLHECATCVLIIKFVFRMYRIVIRLSSQHEILYKWSTARNQGVCARSSEHCFCVSL